MDTSKKLCEIGNMLESFFYFTYIFVGILLVIIGAYMLFKKLPKKADAIPNGEQYFSEQGKETNE